MFSNYVRSGPNLYLCNKNAVTKLDELLSQFKQPYIVTGEKSYNAFIKIYPQYSKITRLRYNASVSEENMQELASKAKDADVIIAIGGGKVLDTAKGVADILDCKLITIPTVLGTCAAYTPIAAVYNLDHSFKKIAFFKNNVYCCLIDITLLLGSPVKYLLSGIGDTLAKWYEADAIVEKIKEPLTPFVTLGIESSVLIKQLLFKYTHQAISDFNNKIVSHALLSVIETIVGLGGTVGGFAVEQGRVSGAHAVHNGLSLFKDTHEIEHGIKVAYGILVQLAAMQKFDQIMELLPFYQDNNFITNFAQLEIKEDKTSALNRLAEYLLHPQETFVLAVPDATKEQIIQAIIALDNITNN